jgi:hypothetical protein
MKTQYKKILKLTLLTSLVVSLNSSCVKDDFFELPDRGGIDVRIWSNEGAIDYMLNKTYSLVVPEFIYQYNLNNYNIHLASDENVFSGADQWPRKVLGLNGVLINNDVRYIASKYQWNNAGDNRYFDIARCNMAIKGIPEGDLPENIKKKMLGQFYAIRAIIYFELVRIYGGVPLVLEPQDPNNLNLSGRKSAEECFQLIFSDFDNAIEMLDGVVWSDNTERGKINKVIAAALKGRAALYYASELFNPTSHPTYTFQQSKWDYALTANKQAYDLAKLAGHDLVPDYKDIFLIEGPANKEAIFVRSHSRNFERRGHNTEARVRPNSEGGSSSNQFQASKILVDAYMMEDGNPRIGHPDYDDVVFWEKRDPRFKATIAYNGSDWDLSGKTNRKQWNYVGAAGETSIKGFYCKRFATPNLAAGDVPYSNNRGGSGMDWIELRYAEVLLNYAECLNETGQLEEAKKLVRLIRKRAGVKENGVNDYGLARAVDRLSMQGLLDNERMIEFAFEGKRNHDLRRRRLMHKLQGTIEILDVEPLNATKKNELDAIVDPVTNKRFRDNLNMADRNTVLAYFKYPYRISIQSGNSAFSSPEHYYFYTFHNQFMNSSPLLEHTIGWDNGTFDPLKQ